MNELWVKQFREFLDCTLLFFSRNNGDWITTGVCQGLYQIWMGLRLITDSDACTRARTGDLIDPQCQLAPDGQQFSLLQAAFIFRPFLPIDLVRESPLLPQNRARFLYRTKIVIHKWWDRTGCLDKLGKLDCLPHKTQLPVFFTNHSRMPSLPD